MYNAVFSTEISSIIKIVLITSVIARPSIPSIKLIAFIIAKIIKIVNIWARILFISNNPKTPCKLSIISPLSMIILAAMIWNINFNLKSIPCISSYNPTVEDPQAYNINSNTKMFELQYEEIKQQTQKQHNNNNNFIISNTQPPTEKEKNVVNTKEI